MRIIELINKLGLSCITSNSDLEKVVKGVYICDLLSWVMAKAKKDDLWITVLTSLNIVAVASMVDVACVVIPEGIQVEEATIKKAEQNDVIILKSNMPAYEIGVSISKVLIKGTS